VTALKRLQGVADLHRLGFQSLSVSRKKRRRASMVGAFQSQGRVVAF
jgi:hypothetical protein